jgi:hypothetical protein
MKLNFINFTNEEQAKFNEFSLFFFVKFKL